MLSTFVQNSAFRGRLMRQQQNRFIKVLREFCEPRTTTAALEPEFSVGKIAMEWKVERRIRKRDGSSTGGR